MSVCIRPLHLTWDEKVLVTPLAQVSREQGRLLGKMEALEFDLRTEAHLHTLTEGVVKSSEIEGVVEMMLDTTGPLCATAH